MCRLYSFLFFIAILHFNTAIANIDSLISLIPYKTDTHKVKLLNEISSILWNLNTSESIEYANMALNLSEELGYLEGKGSALFKRGVAYNYKGYPDSALSDLNNSLKIFQQIESPKDMASVYNNLGIVYYDLSDFEQAFESYFELVKIAEQKSDTFLLSTAYNNIANVFYAQKNYEKALEYHFISLEIGEKLNHKAKIASSCNNIGIIYRLLNDHEKAIAYFTRTYDLANQINHKLGMSYALSNLGGVYLKSNDSEKALEYFKKSLDIKYQIENKSGIASCLGNMGRAYNELKQYDKAIILLEEATEIYEQLGDKLGSFGLYEEMSYSLSESGNYKDALEYYKIFSQLKDTIFNEESVSQITELEAKYQNDKKSKEIILLEKEKNIASLENQKYKTIIIFSSVVFLLACILFFTTYLRYIEKKRVNAELEKLSLVASKTDNYVTISDKEDKILWINDGFTRITGFDSHDIKNKTLPELLRGDETDQATTVKIEKDKQKGVPFTHEILNYKKDGSPVWLMFNVTPIKKATGEIEKYIAIGSDISERKMAEEKLNFYMNTLADKNKSIEESIKYAQHIQKAILPPSEQVKKYFEQSFIMFKPKDIVSGDFYWVGHHEKSNTFYFSVIDCTGHGVPGAFMSIVGYKELNQTINESGISKPAQILDHLSTRVEESLRQKNGSHIKDGMDLALCAINYNRMILEYAGANNSIYIVRKKSNTPLYEANGQIAQVVEYGEAVLYEIKADRQPIGYFENKSPFNNQTISIKKGDLIYIFSDGYADQFGGEKGKKLKYKAFKQLFLEIHDQPMYAQKLFLESYFNEWRGGNEQLDDVCIMGVKV